MSDEDRKTRCRYLRRNGEQCTAEAVDPDEGAVIYLCSKHAGRVMQLIAQHETRQVRSGVLTEPQYVDGPGGPPREAI